MNYVPQPAEMEAEDALPTVANRKQSNASVWIFAAFCLLGGWMVFSALSASRDADAMGGLTPSETSLSISSPPPLDLPAEWDPFVSEPQARPVLLRQIERPAPGPQRPPQTRPAPPSYSPRPSTPPAEPIAERATAGPAPRIVYDAARDQRPVASPRERGLVEEDRVRATRFANPAFTVPRGTVIPAVLETAIDSTRPGAVRALVQRPVRGFDGSRVLIQRGSRLFGTYEGGIAQGQKRALVRWTRLIRPDGVVINLDSPASDPLGRAGIEGDVDTHFWTRFGNALLGSAVTIGTTAAQGAFGGGGVILQNGVAASQTETTGVQPTLRVDHGTSVSVFVAQDLDFADVDQ
jgi:type IV secretion system protein VirB10